jgi:Glycosyltransferase family 87
VADPGGGAVTGPAGRGLGVGGLLRSRTALALAALLIVAGWNLFHDASVVDRGVPAPLAWGGLFVLALVGYVAGELGARRRWPDGPAVEGAAGALALLGVAAVLLVGPRTSPTGDAAIICLAAAAALALGYPMGRCSMPDGGRAARLAFAVAALVVATWAVHDAPLALIGDHFYDLQVYLAAGHHALAGQPIYLTAPLAALPARGAVDDLILYPPPLIPFFELLAELPYLLVSLAWLVGLVAAAFLAFRLLGLSWRWSALLLAFPPLVKGFESGNVASLLFLIMAAGFRFGPGLVAGTLFKVQSVIPIAWLVRERRWRDLVAGGLAVAALCAASLPLTGIGAWRDWLAALGYRAQSQDALPILYGDSIARFLPPAVFVAVALAAVAAVFFVRGRRGLAASGIATIVASPTLWPHGFVLALPALLGAPSAALAWAGLGFGTFDNLGPWLLTVLAGAMLLARTWDGESVDADPTHPLAGRAGPWAAASPSATGGASGRRDASGHPTAA